MPLTRAKRIHPPHCRGSHRVRRTTDRRQRPYLGHPGDGRYGGFDTYDAMIRAELNRRED